MIIPILNIAYIDNGGYCMIIEANDGKVSEKCILCGLCAKICKYIGVSAITKVDSIEKKAIVAPYNNPESGCIGCASCARKCPTGAITMDENAFSRTIWNKEFPMQLCEDCEKPVGTLSELAYAAKIIGREPPKLCCECRRKRIADAMITTYGC
jgi:ferredoxin